VLAKRLATRTPRDLTNKALTPQAAGTSLVDAPHTVLLGTVVGAPPASPSTQHACAETFEMGRH
jgi:hypothetical protein